MQTPPRPGNQAAVQEPGQECPGVGATVTRLSAQRPAGAAEEMGNRGPQHAHQRSADRHSALGRPEQVGAQALPLVFRRNSQPPQSGRRNRHRVEVHGPMRDVHVGHNAPLAPQQQAIERLVERVFQRGVELRPRRTLKDRLQEVVDRGVVAASRSEHRQTHAAAGNRLRSNDPSMERKPIPGSSEQNPFCEHRCLSNHLHVVL